VTQMQDAIKGNITPEMKLVAESEGIDVQKIVRGLSEDVLSFQKCGRKNKPLGIGKGLKTKINANVGSSSELEKVKWEVKRQRQQLNMVQIPLWT